MADSVEILPDKVYVKIEVPQVSARVETPLVPGGVVPKDVPVVLVPGRPGPPGQDGQDGEVIGGAVIEDGPPATNRVWSSQHTADQDAATVDGMTPEVDLTILFNNALT